MFLNGKYSKTAYISKNSPELKKNRFKKKPRTPDKTEKPQI